MLTRFSRILMNEADASPGNGAPAAPAAPAAPSANPEAPAINLDAIVSRLTGVIDEKIQASQNATHAALRKAGVFKQDKAADPAPTAAVQPTTSAPSAQAGLTVSDVDSRLEARLELERVVSTRAGKYGLNEAQERRLRSALMGVSRETLASEADSYLSDLGLAKAQPPPAPPPAPAQATAPAKPNISDRGSAAPIDSRDSDGVLNTRPLDMTGHDFDALVTKHGPEEGMRKFQESVLAALSKVRIKPPGR